MRTFRTTGATATAGSGEAPRATFLGCPLPPIMRCATLAQVVDFFEFSVAIHGGARGLRELAGSGFGHTVMQRRVARAGSVPTRRRGPEARRQSKQERIHDKVSRPKTIAGLGPSPRPRSLALQPASSDRKLAPKPSSHCLARANAGGARGRRTAQAYPSVQGDSFRFLSFLVHLFAVAARRGGAIERRPLTAAPKECR